MDLVRAWVTALAVFLPASLITTLAAIGSNVADDGLTGTGDRIVWNFVPMLFTFAAMTVLTALAHPRPQRLRPRRHALATLAPPLVLIPAALAYGLVSGPAVAAWSGFAGALAGTAAGWIALRLRPARQTPFQR